MAAPATVKNLKGKYRVVEEGTKTTVKNAGDLPIDGGGFQTGSAAERMARAANFAKG